MLTSLPGYFFFLQPFYLLLMSLSDTKEYHPTKKNINFQYIYIIFIDDC